MVISSLFFASAAHHLCIIKNGNGKNSVFHLSVRHRIEKSNQDKNEQMGKNVCPYA